MDWSVCAHLVAHPWSPGHVRQSLPSLFSLLHLKYHFSPYWPEFQHIPRCCSINSILTSISVFWVYFRNRRPDQKEGEILTKLWAFLICSKRLWIPFCGSSPPSLHPLPLPSPQQQQQFLLFPRSTVPWPNRHPSLIWRRSATIPPSVFTGLGNAAAVIYHQ